MSFRRRAQPTIGHEERLRAQEIRPDERDYRRARLCILAPEDGDEVTGLRVP